MIIRQVSINPQKPLYKAPIFTKWYVCPACNCGDIMNTFNHCPGCGAKIIWQTPEPEKPLNTYVVAGIQVRKSDAVTYFGPETYRASSKDDLVVQLKKNYPGLLRDLKIIEIKRKLPQQE